jgi:hypothetical protein
VIARLHSVASRGILLRGLVRSRIRRSVAFGEIATAERLESRWGYRLHGRGWQNLVIVCRPSQMRRVEGVLRARGVVVVDQFGARIDDSQFAKEADPNFNRNVDDGLPSFFVLLFTPNFLLRRRSRRAVRQWSDDAEG